MDKTSMNNNTELSEAGIFDIHDWGQVVNLNAFLGQINLAEQLQEKINQFKEEFIYSHTYSLKDLLENDNVCWLTFRYIPIGNYSRISKNKVIFDEGYKGKVIVGTSLFNNYYISSLSNRNIYMHYPYSLKHLHISVSDNIIKYLSPSIKKDYYIKRLYLENEILGYCYTIKQLQRVLDQNPVISIDCNSNDLENIPYTPYNILYQNFIIDRLGGKNFIENLNKKLEKSINKLRSSIEILGNTDYRFSLNKYNQPVCTIPNIRSIKNSKMVVDNSGLSIIFYDECYNSNSKDTVFKFSRYSGQLEKIFYVYPITNHRDTIYDISEKI